MVIAISGILFPTPASSRIEKRRWRAEIIVPEKVFVFLDLLQRDFASALFHMELKFRELNLDSAAFCTFTFRAAT
jgi:hypothetical protein